MDQPVPVDLMRKALSIWLDEYHESILNFLCEAAKYNWRGTFKLYRESSDRRLNVIMEITTSRHLKTLNIPFVKSDRWPDTGESSLAHSVPCEYVEFTLAPHGCSYGD